MLTVPYLTISGITMPEHTKARRGILHEHNPLHSEERPLSMQVFGAFHRVMQAHRQLMGRKVSEHGAHPGQAICMREVVHHPGINQRDLAERLHLARPTVTVMLQKLEKAGLIERRPDENDQRFTRIYPTELGNAQHLEMHEVLGEVVDASVAPMCEKDQLELKRLLMLMADNMETALQATDGKDRR